MALHVQLTAYESVNFEANVVMPVTNRRLDAPLACAPTREVCRDVVASIAFHTPSHSSKSALSTR
ncbi:hypothetical protein Mycsm_05568 [Mycobacterium sp. JS623]|nr:hypothetical protein Mycsm_05568 [Mycobacterium sp. JS623]